MSTITIKNIPQAIHRTLKARAKAHGRSLNREVIAILEGSLHGCPIDADTVGRRARAVRETLSVYLTQSDLTSLKNTGRR